MLLREELLQIQRGPKKKVKVFRPLFVNSWLLTLQIFITERHQSLNNGKLDDKDEASK